MKRGDRVELVRCADPHTKLKAGDRGTVMTTDSLGTVFVRWDSGSRLGMIPGEDEFRLVEDET